MSDFRKAGRDRREPAVEENFVGYLLEALDARERDQVEKYLHQHPEALGRMDLLRQALVPLELADGEVELPPGLADRTLAAVARLDQGALPRAPKLSGRSLASSWTFWRRADVLVAACLLLLVGSIAVTWIARARHQAGLSDCQNDLFAMYNGIQVYKDVHGKLPNVHNIAKPPRNVAGMVVPKLIAAGCLDTNFCVHAPDGKKVAPPLTYDQAVKLSDEEFQSKAGQLTPCYGFALGYRDENGELQGPQYTSNKSSDAIVLMADRPPANPYTGNSPNHDGKGQNVLFLSGKVGFFSDRSSSFQGDDLYLNKNQKVGAGVNWDDNVVGDSRDRP